MAQFGMTIATWASFFFFVERVGMMELKVSHLTRNAFMLAFVICSGLGQTTRTVVSTLIGEGRSQELVPAILKLAALSYGGLWLLTHGYLFYPDWLASHFLNHPRGSTPWLPHSARHSVALQFYALSSILIAVLQGAGFTKPVFLIEFISVGIYVVVAYAAVTLVWTQPIDVIWRADWIYFICMILGAAGALRALPWRQGHPSLKRPKAPRSLRHEFVFRSFAFPACGVPRNALFAATCLEQLLQSRHEVVGVVTAPDRPAGRGQSLRASDVKKVALQHNLPLAQPEKLKDETFHAQLDAWNADLGVVVAFRMLPEVVWHRPRLGTINLHGSLLPQYRGAAPIHWAVLNGETTTGASTFLLKHEIDTGHVLDRVEIPIGPDDTTGLCKTASWKPASTFGAFNRCAGRRDCQSISRILA